MGEGVLWIDPTGAQTPMDLDSFVAANQSGVLALIGRQNFFGVPTAIVADRIPMQPGAREKYVQIDPNNPFLPIAVKAPSETELAQARRALKWSMNPQRGMGVLRNTAADGVQRDLNCKLVDGLRGDESDQTRGPGWFTAGLSFYAADPYWYDTADTIQNFVMTGTPPLFLASPFLPIKLGASGIGTSFTVSNSGDVEAWPIWQITGPGSAITLTNTTTGDSLVLTITLASSAQILTIDTRPGKKTVKREDGSNQFAAVSSTSSLWNLATGANAISIAMSGTTSASLVQLIYRQRYEGV
jgi:Siphovirus-type tail component, C-terminal domain